MKTLKISEEEARKLYPSAPASMKAIFEATFGTDIFLTKITDRIKTFEDVLKILGISGLSLASPSSIEDKAMNAMRKLFLVVKAYNEGWTPDWSNSNQGKYTPYKYKNSGGSWSVGCGDWCCVHRSPSGLHFKSSELALDAIRKFPDLYNDFLMIQDA